MELKVCGLMSQNSYHFALKKTVAEKVIARKPRCNTGRMPGLIFLKSARVNSASMTPTEIKRNQVVTKGSGIFPSSMMAMGIR